MKCNFIENQEAEFNHLIFEIDSTEKVKAYGLKTLLPPKNILSGYYNDPKNTGLILLRNYFTNHYKEQEYEKIVQEAKEIWEPKEKQFFDALKKIIKKNPISLYDLHITLFGPGGSYLLPNVVFVRGTTKEDKEYFDVNIAHEIIHLNIEEKIKELSLSHKNKELLVGAILFQPEIAQMLGLKNKQISSSNPFFNKLDDVFICPE